MKQLVKDGVRRRRFSVSCRQRLRVIYAAGMAQEQTQRISKDALTAAKIFGVDFSDAEETQALMASTAT
jgi:hypothetical protein